MAKDIKGKVVLVTGSASGLGLSMVEHFLKNGAKLAIMLDLNNQQGLESLQTIKNKYGNESAIFLACDVVKDLEKIYAAVTNIGYVDIVVNNAGILDECSILKTMSVNAIAVMDWTMKFFDYMRKDKGGKGGTIINVSSIYGYRVTPYIPYYHGSKFAVLGFSKSLGHEYNFNKTAVRVVTFCPGLTVTNLTNAADIREKCNSDDFNADLKNNYEWQEADDIGRGMIETVQQADSGSVWLVEGRRPAEMINV